MAETSRDLSWWHDIGDGRWPVNDRISTVKCQVCCIAGTFLFVTGKADPYYKGIVRAVGEILSEKRFVAPVEVFVHLKLLSRADLEDWRFGRVPYLEKVIHCNLSNARRILRLLRFHAHDLNLKPSHTAYVKWGKRSPLRFSKTDDPKLEEAYSRHFISPVLTKKVGEGVLIRSNTTGDSPKA